jgi:hypothetical protein
MPFIDPSPLPALRGLTFVSFACAYELIDAVRATKTDDLMEMEKFLRLSHKLAAICII